MILHSVVPAEFMAQMMIEHKAALNATLPQIEIRAEGQRYLEGQMQEGRFVLRRIISTNPADYLKDLDQPG